MRGRELENLVTLIGDSKPRWRIRTVLRDIGGMWLTVVWKGFRRFWMTTLICDCKP